MDRIEKGARYVVTHARRGQFEFGVEEVAPSKVLGDTIVYGTVLTQPKGARLCDVDACGFRKGDRAYVSVKTAVFRRIDAL